MDSKFFLFLLFLLFFLHVRFLLLFLKKFEEDLYIYAKMIIINCNPIKHMFGYIITYVFIVFFVFFFLLTCFSSPCASVESLKNSVAKIGFLSVLKNICHIIQCHD